jgi:hypothetical protein
MEDPYPASKLPTCDMDYKRGLLKYTTLFSIPIIRNSTANC